jgi:hypothetical protein
MRTSQSTAGGSTTASAGAAAISPSSGLGSGPGQRLPVPPRERKPALAALAVLLILGGALTSAYLVMASGQRVSAIRIAQPVAAGQQIPADALEEVQVGNTGVNFIRWSEHGRVTQAYAAVPLVQGSLLTNQMMTTDAAATQGRVTLGLALKPGQLPSQPLDKGDHVAVYAVSGDAGGGATGGTLLANDAIVQDVRKIGEGTLESNQTRISLAVPPEQAPGLAQAASAGAAVVALVPPGTTLPGPSSNGRPPAKQTPGQGGQQNTTPGGQQGGGQQNGGQQTATPGGG